MLPDLRLIYETSRAPAAGEKLFNCPGSTSSMVVGMAVDIGTKIDALHEELALIRAKLEALEEMLSEEVISEDDRAALEEALREHERGETVPLDEALRKLK